MNSTFSMWYENGRMYTSEDVDVYPCERCRITQIPRDPQTGEIPIGTYDINNRTITPHFNGCERK